jgi:hypothetical protein
VGYIMRTMLLLFIFALGPLVIQAQEIHAKDTKEEITIKKDRFLKKTNWIAVGIGYGQKLNSSDYSFPGSLNAYFHVKNIYFNAGIMRSKLDVLLSKYSGNYLTDIHGTVGFRTETRKSSFSYFAGPSYVHGLLDSATLYKGIGAYAEIQYIQKIYYDIGLGSSVFVNYNRDFPIVGIRLDFYFSNAFRGRTVEDDRLR